MPEPVTIARSSFPAYVDWDVLRALGIKHLETLAGDLWTDFNAHDPGITILEVLSYAITDLGYRINQPIEDLLATTSPAGYGEDDNFFSAAEILTVNPVTLLDLRRLLLDVEGVRNAWVEPAERGEVPLFVDTKQCRLLYEPVAGAESGRVIPIDLKGLYRVYLELLPTDRLDACGQPDDTRQDVLDRVACKLNEHRNLCEDFLDVAILGEEQIRLCTEIELAPDADPGRVLLNIYKAVQEFLSPDVRFYTLQQMLQKGKPIEEIYEGRPTAATSNGFIDTDELLATEPRDVIHVSDLYQVIMDVEGVQAIPSLLLIALINGRQRTEGEPWCLTLTRGHRPVLDLAGSSITFYKGALPVGASDDQKRQALEAYREIRTASRKAALQPYQLDLSVPPGRYLDLAAYTSVQHDFPLVYGVGEAGVDLSGLEGLDREARIAQAKQLKGYLLFFDQILASYLGQLSGARELFRVRGTPATRTYFSQVLTTVPDLDVLIDSTGYGSYLQSITETAEIFDDRRNRVLDHLMARFAESFSEYVLTMYSLEGERLDRERIIKNKERFLEDYAELSHDRGRAFNYAPCTEGRPPVCSSEDLAADLWDTESVAGLQKRTARLVGIEDYSRRTLTPFEVVEDAAHVRFSVEADDKTILHSTGRFADVPEATAAFDALRALAADSSRYVPVVRSALTGTDQVFGFAVTDEDGKPVAVSARQFSTTDERDAAQSDVLSLFQEADESKKPKAVIAELPGAYMLEMPGLLVGTGRFASEEAAWEEGNRAIELIHSYGLRRVQAGAQCTVELVTSSGELVCRHPIWYDCSATEDVPEQIITRANDEGFHLLEHILLRPRTAGIPQALYYQLDLGADKAPYLVSAAIFSSDAEAQEALRMLLRRILVMGRSIFSVYSAETGTPCKWSFHVTGTPDRVAEHGSYYVTQAEAEAAVEDVITFVQESFSTNALAGDEQCYGGASDQSIARSALLNTPLELVDLGMYVHSLEEGEPPDALLYPFRTCEDDGGGCPDASDPYSFQATVVLPYWTERFRSMAFRRFFERTIRLEAPAHVFLKICWVDVPRMHAFESAYRAWLPTLACPERPCHAGQALAALIDSLYQLKNVYPIARLNDCGGESGPPVILSQTLLGSANTDTDGDS